MAEIEFRAEGFNEATQALQGARELVLLRMQQMLREIGEFMLPAVQARTPVGATHHLRNAPYSHYRIQGRGEDMVLEIRQSASSPGGYFYGMAVVGGTRPHFPPYRKLIPWVNAVLGVQGKQAASVAFLVARKISRVGTEPNPYPEQALNENRQRIQDVVNEAGIELAAELWKPRR